ncbi:NADase-type glycan-binding domain-containing protein [Flammeovirga aprica]|uniref:AXH domain-containing protein n=1 Tax=Flammeovirga aprica JL-4 TaxID=694437 RepID=A0A7X9RZR9_9BACT|nr:hypothetical protein [Flammeovirga aprica]NME71748.1 hypothetical protein [Flammeovirga aprica JL-4]
MKQVLVTILILLSQNVFSQIKQMYPNGFSTLYLSAEGEKEFNKNYQAAEVIWEKMSEGTQHEDLSEQEKEVLLKVDETKIDYYSAVGEGCSWYCGGGPKSVTASSFLQSQGKNNYTPENAHDLNFKSAWVEGKEGYGIGEYLLYTFEANSPRINEIIVANGYVKTQSAWENNSRVKKLKLYINDKPYSILNLSDKRAKQFFRIGPIGKFEGENAEKDWTLKFEILEVYEGNKYDDVAISEIFFDGLDVHCFAKGTKVQMSDQTSKNIEDIKAGDLVSYLDRRTQTLKTATVQKMESLMHHHLVTYHFESGVRITATQDHPFQLSEKGWASLRPNQSKQYKGFENTQLIKTGDVFLTGNGNEKLVSIEFLEGHQQTYTISKLSEGDNFIANGFVVGVEELEASEGMVDNKK